MSRTRVLESSLRSLSQFQVQRPQGVDEAIASVASDSSAWVRARATRSRNRQSFTRENGFCSKRLVERRTGAVKQRERARRIDLMLGQDPASKLSATLRW
jgi:hypothetical protein